MKRAFLLIVVPALLVALGFAQTPAASINTDQTIKGCLGGSDGNYTVVEDSTGHIFKITTNTVDFKQHLGHDVTLIGRGASGASSAAADNSSFAVTELNMISEHCAAAAAAPTATVTTPTETAVTPDAAAAAPAATTSTLAETEVTPAADAASTAVAVTPPVETAVTPAADAASPAATVSTPSETISTPAEIVSTPVAAAAHPARLPALQKLSATPAAATIAPAATASTSSETVITPDAGGTTPALTANTSSEPVSTPTAVATTPTATSRGWSLWFLIAFAVLVIVIGTMVPFLNRWRKRKSLERTGAPNLSFTREASSDQGKSDSQEPRKAA